MIDESFHLTPLDVRRTDFPGALRGYDKARVDEFRDRVAYVDIETTGLGGPGDIITTARRSALTSAAA